LVKDLNVLYQSELALHERNFSAEGFEWIDHQDASNSVLAWIRKGASSSDQLLFIANFTPVVRENYRIGVFKPGYYQEVFNSDNLRYGGADVINVEEIESFPIPKHKHMHSLPLTLPPLGVMVLRYSREFEWL
jgi:1,4-alpha-glucan branching enzyme